MSVATRRTAALVALLVALLLVPVARAATVTVVDNDGPGEGFNDPTVVPTVSGNPGTTRGAQRLFAFQTAASIWGALLTSAVEIRIAATFDPLPCNATSATLGQAAPGNAAHDFAGAPFANTWYPIALANALAGMDLDPGGDDIVAQFNSNFGAGCAFPGGFYYGLDSSPPGVNDSDFITVILHELGHGLGFTTFVDEPTGAKLNGRDDTFMRNLEDHSTGKLWPIMTDAERVTSSIDTGDLHWVGANVVAGGVTLISGRDTGSGHVLMFAPDPQQPGSSVAHWDTSLTPDEVQEPVYTGPNHNPGLTVYLLQDIGWPTGPPTPSTTTTTSTLPPPPPGDDYMCDKAAVNPKAGGVKFDKTSLPTRSLQDQLGTETCTFKKENFVCPPVLPAAHPAIHQVSYQIVCPTRFTPTLVTAVDQFFPGGVPVRLTKKFNVLVPSGKIDLGPVPPVPPAPPQTVPPAPPALTVDHFLCYKVKGPTFVTPVPMTVQDQFYPGGYPGLAVYKMTKLCTPVNKAGEDPTAPSHATHLTCYQVKLPRGTLFNKTNVSTNNTNFGAQVLGVKGVGELCVPALKTP